MDKTVTQEYLDGITDARKMFNRYGMGIAREELDNLNRTIRGFPASSPVGQLLRGERDFWRHKLKTAKQED